MNRIQIHPTQALPGGWRYTASLHWGWGRRARIQFTSQAAMPAGATRITGAMMLAFMLPAMRLGKPVEVMGPIDEGQLSMLDELAGQWAAWYPEQLRKIDIHSSELTKPSKPVKDRAVACFSGGVDSCYSMLKHGSLSWLEPSDRLPLESLLMIHGMDIPLKQETIFARALERARATAACSGLPVMEMSTDCRKLARRFRLDWGCQFHGLMLGACLLLAGDSFSHGLIPATYPAFDRVLPWGSNSVTDPLMSTPALKIVHDGDEEDKLGKIGRIHGIAEISRNLRVCWQGESLDRNCGQCFKCTATQLALALHGNERPACFETTLQLDDVRNLHLRNQANRRLFERYLSFAQSGQLNDLAKAIQDCLVKNKGQVC